MAALILQMVNAQAALMGLRRRRALPRIPRQLPTRPIERDYLHDLVVMMSPARALVMDRLIPELSQLQREAGIRDDDCDDKHGLRLDAWAERIDQIMDGVRVEYTRKVPRDRARETAREAAGKTERHNREQLNRQFRSLLRFDVIGTDPQLDGMSKAFVQENVKLITSIPSRYFDDVETSVIRAFRSGQRADQVAEKLVERYDISASRAALIARDQVGKFNGELNKVRQTNIGVERYTWRTSKDERVRESHAELEGEVFNWDGGRQPPEGHPGMPIQCRCSPEPYLADVIDAL